MNILLKPGTLYKRLLTATEHALNIGALFPVPTFYEFIEDHGVRFFVRILTSLARKDEERKKQESSPQSKINPFLPYDKDLFVAEVSETHVAILNKFNVVEHHLLIITREFEDQEMLLTVEDFQALWACLFEYEGLGFYNGGEAAGASQSHKHLQIVPLPLAPEGPRIPIEPLLKTSYGAISKVSELPFINSFVRFDQKITSSLQDAALNTFDLYCNLLQKIGLAVPKRGQQMRQSAPYCLLVTREWMLLVPRSKEFFEGISINSLGFAGALLVRNEEQMDILKKYGPMKALQSVAVTHH